ncbi:MAG: hypothetical protein IJ406_06515 [Oscillospiraceae bacterium]|nr:hypothetical protein [Oscillospiraceae bacterium]
MIILEEKRLEKIPCTYQDWMNCFNQMKEEPLSRIGYEQFSMGEFWGSEATLVSLENQMVDAINVVLNRIVKRFLKDFNECLMFNELSQMDSLFKKLKKDINRVMFFLDLNFLSDNFKKELYNSVSEQMLSFWNDTIDFLQKQANEYYNSDLEDVLFLIKRIKLFS